MMAGHHDLETTIQEELKDVQNKIMALKEREKYLLSMERECKEKILKISEQKGRSFEKTLLEKLSAGNHALVNQIDLFEPGEKLNELPLPTIANMVIHEIIEKVKSNDVISFQCISVGVKECDEYTIIESSIKHKNLPDVDYLLRKELVALKVAPKLTMNRKKKANEPVTYYSIANFQINDDGYDGAISHTIEFKLLTKEYIKMVDKTEIKKGTSLVVDHITGLIPSERCHDALTMYPSRSPPYEAPSEWPNVLTDIDCGKCGWCSTLEARPSVLNDEQSRVVACVPHLSNGMYFITGPPGTGKSLMNAYSLAALILHNREQRYMFAAPSNAAVNAEIVHLISLKQKKLLLKDTHFAFIGAPSKLPEECRELSISWFWTDLKEPFLKPKKNWPQKEYTDLPKYYNVLKKKLLSAQKKINDLLTSPQTIMSPSEINKSKIEIVLKDFENLIRENEKVLENPTKKLMNKEKLLNLLERAISNVLNNKNAFETFHIQRSNVIFSTLTSSGRPFLRKCFQTIDVLIIDEAAQTHVADVLIPIMHFLPSVTVLVGDPKQLPPIVSLRARELGYGNSLMASYTNVMINNPSLVLHENYRMHPKICAWPSHQYYDSKLRVSALVQKRNDIHLGEPKNDKIKFSFFKYHSAFIDMANCRGDEYKIGHSYRNDAEAEAIVSCLKELLDITVTKTVGVIAFYRAQVTLIEDKLEEYKSSLKETEVHIKGIYFLDVKLHKKMKY